MHFYFEAEAMDAGEQIELRVFNGKHATRKIPNENRQIGVLTFTPEEWESFGPIVSDLMTLAGVRRIPIEFLNKLEKAH